MSETEIRKVKIPLTETETADIGRKLAAELVTLEELEADAKADAKEHRDRINAQAHEVATLREAITSGLAVHDVECAVLRDHAMKRVAYVRDDNGEVVEVRDMTIEEQQMVLGEPRPDDDVLRARIQTFLGLNELNPDDMLTGPDDDVSEIDSTWEDGEE